MTTNPDVTPVTNIKERPALVALLRDLPHNSFNFVIVEDTGRLARDRLQLKGYKG